MALHGVSAGSAVSEAASTSWGETVHGHAGWRLVATEWRGNETCQALQVDGGIGHGMPKTSWLKCTLHPPARRV
jgi:hypothetical protein